MEKALCMEAKFVILSACAHKMIKGSIYIEAPSPLAILEGLRGIRGVLRFGSSVQVDLVSLDNRVHLLQMDVLPSTIKTGSWVQVKGWGLYRQNLGLVIESHKN